MFLFEKNPTQLDNRRVSKKASLVTVVIVKLPIASDPVTGGDRSEFHQSQNMSSDLTADSADLEPAGDGFKPTTLP